MCNPKQVGTIDFSAAGKNCKVLLGDINNDGRMEMIMVQADSGIDDRPLCQYSCRPLRRQLYEVFQEFQELNS